MKFSELNQNIRKLRQLRKSDNQNVRILNLRHSENQSYPSYPTIREFSKGVTIIELIIYIGLMSVFLLVLIDVFVTILNARLDTESTSALDMDARYIVAKLSYDVGNADSITTPGSLGSTSSTLAVVIGGVTDTYSVDANGNLTLNTVKLNGNDTKITSVAFTKVGNPDAACAPELCKPTVKVLFTIESQINQAKGLESRTINTTVGLR